MIDTSSWKEFKLEDILQKVDTQKISLKKSECSSIKTDEYDLPARTATTQNHGLSCYVPRDCATVLNNCISVSANGDYCAFWHDSEFTILQDSYALCGNGFKLTEKVALFLIGCMDRAFSSKYNWNNKSGWEKLRKEYIKLPVTESEEIDWSYMRERIEELERERIEELEQYLIATGLNDYELTDEDKEVLHISGFGIDGKLHKQMSDFAIKDILEVVTPLKRFNANNVEITQNIGFPYVVRSSTNNGIRGYIDEDIKYLNAENTFSFGQDTATVFWQPNPYFTGDKIKVLVPKFNCSENVANYIVNRIRVAFGNFSWGTQSFKTSVIENAKINLPIQTDDYNNPIIDNTYTYHPDGYIPDWDFMEKYIKAIEKIVIADVVKYKDEVIKTTKSIIE